MWTESVETILIPWLVSRCVGRCRRKWFVQSYWYFSMLGWIMSTFEELDADWSSSHDGFRHKSFEHVVQVDAPGCFVIFVHSVISIQSDQNWPDWFESRVFVLCSMYFPLRWVALARAMISHSSTSLRAGHNFSCAIYTTCGSRRSELFIRCTSNLYLHIEFTCKLQVVPITTQEIHMIDRDWSWWR